MTDGETASAGPVVDVREEIRLAEESVRRAAVAAFDDLYARTGLKPVSVKISMLDVSTSGQPYTFAVGIVKITVGI